MTGKRFWIPVRGRSMQPTLPAGSRVLVELCEPATCRPGDVVLVWQDGRTVLHRLVGRRRGRALTWGDNAVGPDQLVSASAIAARAVAAVDAAGRPVALTRGPAWAAWARKAVRAAARRLTRRVRSTDRRTARRTDRRTDRAE